MANGNDVINEIRRYIRRPKITFEKGILRADSDAILGYVSDIKNMEIDKGVAKRREGSKCLNDADTAVKFKKLFWSNISGCDILFGITEQLELVAYVDRWLEVQFKVYKKGLSRMRYKNSTDSFQVKWDQGNEFFVVEDNSSIKIVSDFGEIYKIEKRGYIGLMKSKDANFTYDSIDDNEPVRMLEEARYYEDADFPASATEFGLFLNVVNATNKKPDKFYAIPETTVDSNKTIYPISGNTRIAYVNEDNQISTFGDPINILEHNSYFLSMIPGFSGTDNFKYLKAAVVADGSEDVFVTGKATSTTSGVNSDYEYSIKTSTPGPSYTSYTGRLIVTSDTTGALEYYVYFDNSGILLDLATTNLNKFFYFNVTQRFNPYPADNFTFTNGVLNDVDEGLMEKHAIPGCIAEVESYEDRTVPDLYFTYDSITNLELVTLQCFSNSAGKTVVKLKNNSTLNSLVRRYISNNGFEKRTTPADEVRRVPMKIELASGAGTFFENIVDLLEIEVPVNASNENLEGILTYKNSFYDSAQAKKYNYSVYDTGYDCWKYNGQANNSTISGVDLYTGKIGEEIDRTVLVNPDDYSDYISNGDRFAVWNNDEVIAVSQKGFTSDGLDFIYEDEVPNYIWPAFCEPCISQTDTENKGGTITGATYGDGAMTLDGSSYVEYANTDGIDVGILWTAIAIFNPSQTAFHTVVAKRATATASYNMNLLLYGGVGNEDELYMRDFGGTTRLTGLVANKNQSNFAAIVCKFDPILGPVMFGYLNGASTANITINATSAVDGNVVVGAVKTGPSTFTNEFYGDIYDVKLFPNTAFTVEQLDDIYNGGNYDSSWYYKILQNNNYGLGYNKPELTRLDFAYSPICAPVFKTLRSFPYKIDPFEEIISEPDHIVNNNGRLYCIQGRRLWGGDYGTMKLTTPKDLDYDVYRMEKFFDGVALFTNKGIYRVDARYNIYEVNTSAISTSIVKASTNGNGMVYGVTEDNEVFYIMIMVENNSTPYAKAVLISQAVHNLDWSSEPKMEFIIDTLWIARDDDVWGYYEGGWKKKYEFTGKIIDHITNYNNHLCIAFEDQRTIDVYDLVDVEYNVPIVTEV